MTPHWAWFIVYGVIGGVVGNRIADHLGWVRWESMALSAALSVALALMHLGVLFMLEAKSS